MDLTSPEFPTPKGRRNLPGSTRLIGSALLVGAGLLAGSSLRAAVRVRQMRAEGREVLPLDHDTSLPGRGPVRHFAVVGDSAAAGHGLPDADVAYTRAVGRELVRRDGRATTITNVAVDGATVEDVIVDQIEAVRSAELVVVSVGVNDAIRRRRPSYVGSATRRLLQGIRDRAAPGAIIVLIATPDLSVAPGLPSVLAPPLGMLCRAVARAQARAAAELDVAVISLSREVLPPEVFGEDGFHPGDRGHAVLAEKILAVVDLAKEPAGGGHRG